MSEIGRLGYLGIDASDMAAWRTFSTDVLGLEYAEVDEFATLRMDEYSRRICLHACSAEQPGADDVAYVGFEVNQPGDLATLRERLRAAGVEAEYGSAELARARAVSGLLCFRDPDGLRCEAYYGGSIVLERPFKPSRRMSGFLTGDQGLGHLVLTVSNIDQGMEFFCDVLGFKLSDMIDLTRKGQVKTAYFLHCNGRHHSIALVEAANRKRAVHFMLETLSLDDVGTALDAANARAVPIVASLGRHVNDQMVSFYMSSPSGFPVEYGWGGRLVADATWAVQRHSSGSIWGHKGPMTE